MHKYFSFTMIALLLTNALLSGAAELFTAIDGGDTHKVQKLIQANADIVKKKGSFGATPLHSAIFSGNAKISSLLINAGTDVNAKNSGGPPFTSLLLLIA